MPSMNLNFPQLLSAKALETRYGFSLLAQGLPPGSLIEISGEPGSGKTEILLRFLAENPQLKILWVEKQLSIYPLIFPAYGISLERTWFIQSSVKNALHPLLSQVLRSQVFQVVVLSEIELSEISLRRLQLNVQKSKTLFFVLKTYPTTEGAWPIRIQLSVSRAPGFTPHFSQGVQRQNPQIEIIKWKGIKWTA